ncbi:TlpA family protein disulfide reductase [Pedobacter psychrotolerans]|uniref:TlpA family protein disulfide reductase n=1 Tax=Pedobacter psychrotolerans TaxID=1843235 RepID=UPI003F954518
MPEDGEPEYALASITSDFAHYWNYHDRYVKLYRDFSAIDEDGKTIKKEAFLRKLTSGKFLPLLIHTENSGGSYKLVKIPAHIAKDGCAVIAANAKTELRYFKMEGKPIPAFNFKDINGVEYSSANTKGKIVLFKCWFIGCSTCVKEMPELNKMVEKYNNRKDILFVSLAIDDKKPLQEFLTKTKFEYATVPGQDKYMTEKLKVAAYPTHFLINKNGILVKTVNTETAISEVLEQLAVQ